MKVEDIEIDDFHMKIYEEHPKSELLQCTQFNINPDGIVTGYVSSSFGKILYKTKQQSLAWLHDTLQKEDHDVVLKFQGISIPVRFDSCLHADPFDMTE